MADDEVVVLPPAFEAVLRDILRFNDDEVQFLTDQGVVDTDSLSSVSRAQLLRVLKPRSSTGGSGLRALSQLKFEGFHLWARMNMLMGGSIEPELYTHAEAVNWVDQLQYMRDDDDDPSKAPALPEKLKTQTKWHPFKTMLLTHLRGRRSVAGIPLVYVLRDEDAPVPADGPDLPETLTSV
jgi:hypothetical protein